MEPGEVDSAEFEVSRLDKPARSAPISARVARWSRTRAGRASLSVMSAVVVVGALVGLTMRATPDPAGAFTAAFGLPTATATAPILFGGDVFIVSGMVPWGTLTVDGRRPALSDFPDYGTGFALQRGVHHLVYQAQDFPTLRCVISVPVSAGDTCPRATDNPASVSAAFQRFLDLRATPDRLLRPAYQALVAATVAELATISATTTIQPGERYYSQTGALTTARSPMTFTMGVQSALAPIGDCRTVVCEVGDGASAPTWELQTLVTPTWTVTEPSGASYPSAIPQSQRFPVSIGFHATPAGSGWQAQTDDASPLANVVSATASGALESALGSYAQDIGMNFGRLANAADGAVLQIIPNGSTVVPVDATPGPVHLAEAEVLWRFGVLLTVNKEAQRDLPHWPVASPAERTLAQTVTFYGYSNA